MTSPLDHLPALIGKIAQILATKPECFVTHPAEMRLLQKLSAAELRDIARDRGWRVVLRLGGRQAQFYNDVTVRPVESSRNQPAV